MKSRGSVYKYILSLSLLKALALPSHYITQTHDTKKQSWGTCWAFSTIRSLEINLLKTNSWSEPSIIPFGLSEYYIDKYSGFTRGGDDSHVVNDWYSGQGIDYKASNIDDEQFGLIVHLGGDYKVSAAQITNNGGAVDSWKMPKIQSYHTDHKKFEQILKSDNYSHYMPSDIEWININKNLDERIRNVKESVLKYGAISSVQYMSDDPFSKYLPPFEFQFYYGPKDVNHAVNIIGWDDAVVVSPLLPGAWIVQDSDHRDELDNHIGTFYMSYYDKYGVNDEDMGAVRFTNTQKTNFKKVYSHALHGWRYNFSPENIEGVSNRFNLMESDKISAIGFYTTMNNETVNITITRDSHICEMKSLHYDYPGFHLINTDCEHLKNGNKVEVELRNDSKVYALDASSVFKLLLGESLPKQGDPILVKSKANKGESFYKIKNKWYDLYNYKWRELDQFGIKVDLNKTANFPINLYVK